MRTRLSTIMAKFVFLLLLAVALLPRVATEFDGETFSGSL